MRLSALLLCGVCAFAGEQVVYKSGSLNSFKGSDEFFTGSVHVQSMFPANADQGFSGGLVEFEKGSRSAWHTHPSGQTLIVTKGTIYTKAEGQVAQIAKVGDVVVCPTDVKHFHGAGLEESGAHIALTSTRDGKNVNWMQKVTDEEYNQAIKEAK